MILNSPYISGSLTVTGNITALGGISISGSIASASYAANAELLDGLDSSVFVLSSSFQNYSSSNDGKVAALNTFSASILSYTSSTDDKIAQLNRETASLNLATASINNATASLYAATASIYNFTSSANLRIGSLEQYTQSLNTRSASFACVTATNNFGCAQYFSNASNAISFSSTGSLYSDGGMRITKDMYVSGTAFFNNVTVFGTQSVAYISSSQLNIGTNIISVNTDTPTIRFGGLAVYDSGSTGLTGSILWDSENNHWVYSNPSGSSYSGGMFISGPRSAALGSEQGTTACMLLVGQGGDHLTSSMIYHSSTTTCIPNTLIGNTVSAGTITSVCGVISGTPAQSSSLLLENFNGDQTATTLKLKSGRADVFYHMQAFSSNTSEVFRIESSGRVVSAAGACFASTVCAPAFVGGTVSGTTGTFSGKLSVSQASTDFVAEFTNTANSTPYGLRVKDAGTPANNYPLLSVTNNAGSTEYFRVNSGTGITTFSSTVCSPSLDIMPSGIGSSTLGGIMRVVTTGTSAGIAVGQSNANRYTHIAANDIQVFNDDFFLSTRCAFPLSIGTCYTARLTFAATGVACFSCQICAPNATIASCLGVGVASPQGNFEVVGLSYFTRSNSSLLLNPNYGGANTHVQLQVICNMALAFATNGDNERMRITNAGNVGIGALNVTNKLIVIGSETGTQITTVPIGKFVNTGNSFSKFIIGSDNSNYDAVISMDNNATLANTKLRFYIGNGTNSTAGHSNDQIVLQGNGNVGVNIVNPNSRLHVLGSTSIQNRYEGSDDGLILHYSFSEQTGNCTVDRSQYGIPATFIGNTTWNSNGIAGGGVYMDGCGDYLTVCAPPSSISMGTNMTYSSWLYVCSFAGKERQYIFDPRGDGNSSGMNSYFLFDCRGSNCVRFTVGNNDVEVISSPSIPFNTGVWNHVAATRCGSTWRIYLNGTEVHSGTTNNTSLAWNNSFRIGTFSNSGSGCDYYFNGVMDEVRMYNRTLSIGEIREQYHKGGLGHYAQAQPNGYSYRALGFTTGTIAAGGSCLVFSCMDRGLYLISVASSVSSDFRYAAFLWVNSSSISVSSVITSNCVSITSSGRALCVVNPYTLETAQMTISTVNLVNSIG